MVVIFPGKLVSSREIQFRDEINFSREILTFSSKKFFFSRNHSLIKKTIFRREKIHEKKYSREKFSSFYREFFFRRKIKISLMFRLFP